MMVNLPCLMESCSNFLRPTCSYTECRLSFLTGSCPMEGTSASYSSCLYLILPTLTFLQGTDIQWTLCLVFPFVGLVADIMHKASLSLSGFFPEPCSDPELSDPQQGSGIILSVFFVMLPVFSVVPVSLYLPKVSSDHT